MTKTGKTFFLAFICSMAWNSGSAQLTQANNGPAAGDNYTMIACDAMAPGPAGSNLFWDYSALPVQTAVTTYSTKALFSDYDYPSANFSVGPTSYSGSYYISSFGSLKYYGGTYNSGFYSGKLYYTTPAFVAVYPMNLNTASNVNNVSGSITVGPVWGSGTFTGNSKTVLDATGSLILPASTATFENVMRVVNSQTLNYVTNTYSGKITFINYTYFAQGVKAPIFWIRTTTVTAQTGTDTQTLVAKNTTAVPPPPLNPVGLHERFNSGLSAIAYPNPASGPITIETGAPSTVIVFDVLGKQVDKVVNTNGRSEFDVSAYANGLYIYKVMLPDGNLSGSGKFVVKH